MDFIPYKANESFNDSHYPIPKELFNNPYYKILNSDSKLLYSLLLDRLYVSIKNQWYDEDGNVFLIYSRAEAGKKLNLSSKTITKAFKLLNDVKLIYEKRQGASKANLIYVGKMQYIQTEAVVKRKKYSLGYVNNTIHDTENLRSNNNKINNTNINNRANYNQRTYSAEELDKLYCNI